MADALYFRVSTEDQRDRQTIETQAGEVRRYCAQHDIPVYREYADDGVSGTVPFEQRPAGARLLTDARAGHFDTVLVYKLDRLGRDPLVTMLTVEALKKAGVAVQSVTQSFDAEDPTGRLLMTILSGVAGFERDTIIQRSIAGTNRCARLGAWLGGIVPYGYRVEGQKHEARLVIAEEARQGLEISEAGVIRLMYRSSVEERLSCASIAERLNEWGIPPAYVRDGRTLERGKRLGATAGIWRAGRVRNLLTSTTYKGLHVYGRRTTKRREQIARPVPAIVDDATWEAAQRTLRLNAWKSDREGRTEYLLRGLIHCALCRLTYIGSIASAARLPYYRCSGQVNARVLHGTSGCRCPAKPIRADEIEREVWADIEGFLRDPGAVLGELAQQMQAESQALEEVHAAEERLAERLTAKQQESDAVITLFRRGRITQSQLDRQLNEIDREEAGLRALLAESHGRRSAAADAQAQIRAASRLLSDLNARLDQPLTFALKRELVEALVKDIRVQTVGMGRAREAQVTVTYAFGSVENCTDIPADFYATLQRDVALPAAARKGATAKGSLSERAEA